MKAVERAYNEKDDPGRPGSERENCILGLGDRGLDVYANIIAMSFTAILFFVQFGKVMQEMKKEEE